MRIFHTPQKFSNPTKKIIPPPNFQISWGLLEGAESYKSLKGYEMTRMSQVNLHRQFLHCFSFSPNPEIIGHSSPLTMRLSIPGIKIPFPWVPVGFCTPLLSQQLAFVSQDLPRRVKIQYMLAWIQNLGQIPCYKFLKSCEIIWLTQWYTIRSKSIHLHHN